MTAQPRWSRRSLLRGGIMAGGLALAPSLLSACSVVGGDTLKKIEAGDPIELGMSNEPPFAFRDSDGKVTGQSVVMYSHIIKELGAEDGQIETKIVDWNSLIPGLRADDYDLVAAGMFINSLRCERAIFSEPDYITATTLLVPAGNPNELRDYSSFTDGEYVLGLLAGGAEAESANNSGVPKDNQKELANNNDLVSALDAGQIHAVALTAPAMNYIADTSDGQFETVDPFVAEGESEGAGGAVFRDDDTKFRDAVNDVLADIKSKQESWLSLVEPFGFTENEFPREEFTTEKLCKV